MLLQLSELVLHHFVLKVTYHMTFKGLAVELIGLFWDVLCYTFSFYVSTALNLAGIFKIKTCNTSSM